MFPEPTVCAGTKLENAITSAAPASTSRFTFIETLPKEKKYWPPKIGEGRKIPAEKSHVFFCTSTPCDPDTEQGGCGIALFPDLLLGLD
jgi:hypothetical protein